MLELRLHVGMFVMGSWGRIISNHLDFVYEKSVSKLRTTEKIELHIIWQPPSWVQAAVKTAFFVLVMPSHIPLLDDPIRLPTSPIVVDENNKVAEIVQDTVSGPLVKSSEYFPLMVPGSTSTFQMVLIPRY